MATLGNGVIVDFSANLNYFEKYSQLFGNILAVDDAIYPGINFYATDRNNAITMSNVVYSQGSIVTTFRTVSNLIPMMANVQSFDDAVVKNNQQVSKEQIINRINYRPDFNY